MVSKKIMENIDLEEGRIRIGGKWLTEDEIRYAIKMKVDSDDYNVADLAVALQTLISELNKSAVLRVRVPKEMAEEIEELSKKRGESVQSMLRNILIEFLSGERESTEKLEEEDVIYEDVEEEEPEEVLDEEGELDESFLVNREEEIDISIEDEDVEEEEIEGELLDIDTTANDSDMVEVEAEEDLEAEYIPDVVAIDEEIIEPEVEDLESVKVETGEIMETEHMPDIVAVGEEGGKANVKESGKGFKKKKAAKKKVIVRKKKLRHKEY